MISVKKFKKLTIYTSYIIQTDKKKIIPTSNRKTILLMIRPLT